MNERSMSTWLVEEPVSSWTGEPDPLTVTDSAKPGSSSFSVTTFGSDVRTSTTSLAGLKPSRDTDTT